MDAVMPEERFPSHSVSDRACEIDEMLRSACDEWSGPRGKAARRVMGLDAETYGKTLTERRATAGRAMNTSGEGFKRRHERNVLEEIACVLLKLAGELPYARNDQLRLQLAG